MASLQIDAILMSAGGDPWSQRVRSRCLIAVTRLIGAIHYI
jgi:hypothetical protein